MSRGDREQITSQQRWLIQVHELPLMTVESTKREEFSRVLVRIGQMDANQLIKCPDNAKRIALKKPIVAIGRAQRLVKIRVRSPSPWDG
jgi:hypothetical protein